MTTAQDSDTAAAGDQAGDQGKASAGGGAAATPTESLDSGTKLSRARSRKRLARRPRRSPSPTLRGSWSDIVVVPRKAFLKAYRLELQPLVGVTVNDNLIRHYCFGGDINFFLSDVIWIGVEGQYFIHQLTNQEELVGSEYNRAPTLNQYLYGGSFNFGYAPIYGKFALFNRSILSWEIWATGGLGATFTEVIPRDPVNDALIFKNTDLTVNVGIGSRFFLLDWLTVNFALRDYIIADHFEPTPDGSRAAPTPITTARRQKTRPSPNGSRTSCSTSAWGCICRPNSNTRLLVRAASNAHERGSQPERDPTLGEGHAHEHEEPSQRTSLAHAPHRRGGDRGAARRRGAAQEPAGGRPRDPEARRAARDAPRGRSRVRLDDQPGLLSHAPRRREARVPLQRLALAHRVRKLRGRQRCNDLPERPRHLAERVARRSAECPADLRAGQVRGINSMQKINNILGAQIEFTPFTGKYSFAGVLFANYDFYIFGGGGVISVSPTNTDTSVLAACQAKNADTMNTTASYSCAVSGSKLGGTFGLGLHSYFNHWMALNVELRDFLAELNPSGRDTNADLHVTTDDLSWTHTLTVAANLVFYLPATPSISP